MNAVQADFVRAILNPDAAVPEGLVNPDGAPATRRFNVYRNNVASSLTEALRDSFPAIERLLGRNNFGILAGAFLRRHPPDTPLLMQYGARMPGFLTSFEPVANLPYLPDVARLELALRESYHAADATPLDPGALQSLPPESLMAAHVGFAPAVRLIRSRWPVHGIWARNMADGPKPGTQAEDVLIVRPEFDPELRVLEPGGGSFVAALIQGAAFDGALDTATQDAPAFDLGAVLGVLLSGGAITALIED